MKLRFIIDKKYDRKMIACMGMGRPTLRHLEEQYKTSLVFMKQSQADYQKSWDKIDREFSKYIEKETGHPWFYEKYYCIVSAVHPGISNWGRSEEIVRWWKENPNTQRRITAHELIISHYFEIYRHQYQQHKLKDGQVWALAEIAAFALTSLTPESKKFWPWDDSGYYTNHNYPQIVDLQKKLKQPFLKRKNFDEYMLRGIQLVKRYKNIKP